MTQLNAVNTQISENPNTQKLRLLLDAVKPLFNDLQKILTDSKKLHSKYKHHLIHLNLYFRMNNVKEPEVGEKELDEWVNHIASILEGIGTIMLEISHDKEESKLYLENGIISKLQEIAQKLVFLVFE
ncbi:MAG: hypothetical protein P4L79_11655 [Legionella sp.]|uniref:hypothetical protein n=1 Tax=Legionella sp. TaxID=459 RepID=UPI00283B3EEC|nr:hypothetical protein [Legionella sp.]